MIGIDLVFIFTGGRTAVARNKIAVVAFLTTFPETVSTFGNPVFVDTNFITTVAWDYIAVVTFFGVFSFSISTLSVVFPLTFFVTAVPWIGVSVVTLFAGISCSVSTVGVFASSGISHIMTKIIGAGGENPIGAVGLVADLGVFGDGFVEADEEAF